MRGVLVTTFVAGAVFGMALMALAFATDAHAATPGGAAAATARCLADRGWTTSVRGRTVKARAPRVRPAGSFPRRPQLEVTFSDAPFPPVQVIWALNDREHHAAARCLRGR